MSGNTPGYSQQNGTATVGADGGRSARAAQYRRQGSSYGPGHVHNMAVMVPPTRIDYSVTKGGLRSWVVLIVFVLLCSTMLTIFSDDGEVGDDDVVFTSISEESLGDADDNDIADPENNVPITPDSPDDVDAEDDEDDDEENAARIEAAMLAKLKEKATQREKQASRKTHIIHKKEDDDDDDDNDNDVNKEDERNEEEESQPDRQHSKNNNDDAKTEKTRATENEDGDNEEDDEEDEQADDDHIASEQELLLRRKKASKRQKKRDQRPSQNYLKSWRDSSIQAQKLADDVKNPRKNLLKLKKSAKRNLSPLVDNDEKISDDNDNDVADREEQNSDAQIATVTLSSEPVFEIIAPNKRPPAYDRKAITNRDDFKVRAELDDADFRLEKHDFSGSIVIYERILRRNANSPRGLYGKARALQLRSEFDDSTSDDKDIEEAIVLYQRVLDNDETPDELFRMSAHNLAECARWIGNLHKVLTVQRALIDKFPERIVLQNDFAMTFLQMGRVEDARKVFSNVLESDPTNSVAQAYYGYIFKVHDGDLEKGVIWMRKGLRSSRGEIQDPKFFFHLGDALTRLSREQEALKVYEEAVSLGLFPSIYQRSMHNLDGLVARPWWTLDQTGCGKQLRHIERQWTVIREEARNAWEQKRSIFHNENNHLLDGVEMVVYLRKEWKFSKTECRVDFPNTCEILKKLVEDSTCGRDEVSFSSQDKSTESITVSPQADIKSLRHLHSGCKKLKNIEKIQSIQFPIKISVFFAGSRVWPHCAPTNYELEAHLGLVTHSEARLRVGQTTRGWKSGQFIVYDKSFEHEAWFDGASANAIRIVLSIDLWHPQVPRKVRMHSDADHKK